MEQFLHLEIKIKFFQMFFVKCQISNWWFTSGNSCLSKAWVWMCLSVYKLFILILLLSVFINARCSPETSIATEFPSVSVFWTCSKCKILFVALSVSEYVRSFAEKPGESHRPSPERFKCCKTFCYFFPRLYNLWLCRKGNEYLKIP